MDLWRAMSTNIDGVFVDRCAVGIFPCVFFKVRVFVLFDSLQGHISLTRIRKPFGPAEMEPSWRPHDSQMYPTVLPSGCHFAILAQASRVPELLWVRGWQGSRRTP